ncbi:MAG TPA: hypothetical protein VKH35_14460 [Thermoanaerobaculia bacterium]|jgi:hypothetical protein|nr:hypothetical protein [Thermoanaerobaculia bacterium]
MNPIAETRANPLSIAASWTLPMLLAINTFALLALEQMGQIPAWLKSAVALFLSF